MRSLSTIIYVWQTHSHKYIKVQNVFNGIVGQHENERGVQIEAIMVQRLTDRRCETLSNRQARKRFSAWALRQVAKTVHITTEAERGMRKISRHDAQKFTIRRTQTWPP